MTNKEAIDIFKGFKFLPREQKAVELAIKALEERPKGEWIMQLHNCDGEFYTCSVCGRMIRVSPYVEDNETLKDYPFCHCGADMRGEEE